MKKILISLALLICAGSIMGQEDKAALKLKQKEAKAQMNEATKIKDAIYAKIQEKTAGDPEILSECKKGQTLIQKAIKSGCLAENKLGEAYKLSADLALQPHNVLLGYAASNLPLDTLLFYSNLKTMTNAIHNELKNTKVTKGETGNEGYIKGKTLNLAQCGDYYIYAGQFCSAMKEYAKAIEAYETAMNYTKIYPEVAEMAKLRIQPEQIAYYAYHTAHEGKMYDKMDELYETALQFADGAVGTKQVKVMSYLERGDSAAWAGYIHDMTIKEPTANEDYIQMLLAYYQKKDGAKMLEYANEIVGVNPENLMANYALGFKYFEAEKYDEALKAYQRCTEIKPDYFDAWYQCGLCKYKQALAMNAKVSGIKDQKKAKETLEQTKALFGEAIPYFEKARECAPDEPQRWAFELRQCYTVTGKADKAAEMDALL